MLPLVAGSFQLILMTEIAIFALASMGLYFIMGPGGMLSFGHAAFFGGGAYAAALMVHYLQTPMELALVMAPLLIGLLALIIGWFCVRLSGVYLAMLTLAFAQICWSIVFQWGGFTGGDDGILSIWPSQWAADKLVFYYLTMVLCLGGIIALRYIIFTPFGYTMRACRDSALRAGAIGINTFKYQWAAFAVAGGFTGLAGGIYVFSKGSVFPDEMAITRSFEFLLMVLLGGVDAIMGPIVGPAAFIWLHNTISRIDFWQFILGNYFHCPGSGFSTGNSRIFQSTIRALFFRTLFSEGVNSLMSRLLQVTNLSHSFGGVTAVKQVSFDLEDGQILAMIGPNGAGKSTCFNLINGQLHPDEGNIKIDGQEVVGLKPRHIWQLGVGRTFQVTATFASMTVLENIQVALASFRKKAKSPWRKLRNLFRQEAMELLHLVGIPDYANFVCGVLSYGDLKRVELAVALTNQPRLLLMDEPTAGMEPAERQRLMDLTSKLFATGT